MDIKLKKETISVNETVLRTSTQIVVQSDIIVPDVKSDIAKILQIDSQAMIDKTEAGDKHANISGSVNLNILYVPEGDTKPVCSISTTLPFLSQIENKLITPNSKCVATADTYHVEFSMLNSRKLNVKVVVEIDFRCIQENSIDLLCDISADTAIEKNLKDFEIYNLVCASHTNLPIKETLDFPSGKPNAICILKADAKVCDKDMRLVSGKIVLKGSIGVCTLYVSEANLLESMEHEIPFTEIIDAESVTEDCFCELDINICKTEFSLRPDTNGDMRLMDIAVVMDVGANVMKNTNMSAICDCFCASHMLSCKTQNFCFDTLVGRAKIQEALRATINLPENAPELVSVYNLLAKPYISDVELAKDKAIVKGIIDCYVLYLSASPTMPISTQKAQVEFELPVEIIGLNENMDCDINIEIAHQSYNITMTGEIELRVSVLIEAEAIGKTDAELVVDAEIDTDSPLNMRHGIIIYFVRPGDSLWKISKRYNVSPELVAQINQLDNPDILNVGQRLLIPNMMR